MTEVSSEFSLFYICTRIYCFLYVYEEIGTNDQCTCGRIESSENLRLFTVDYLCVSFCGISSFKVLLSLTRVSLIYYFITRPQYCINLSALILVAYDRVWYRKQD